MGYETKLGKSFTPIEHQRLGLGIFAGLVLSLTYLSPSMFYSFPSTIVNLRSSSMDAALASQMTNDSTISSQNLGLENAMHETLLKDGSIRISNIQSANVSVVAGGDANITHLLFGKVVEKNDGNLTMESKNSSISKGNVRPEETKPLCDFSNRRSNICDMHGDVRIHGKSSSVVSVTSVKTVTSQGNETWRIRPYARKTDLNAMSDVRELTVRSSSDAEDPPRCAVNHAVPAVVFSVAGYTGNFFHDFTDVLVPLFLTSYQFNGEVQFLVTNFRLWWINKYRPIIASLSKHELIDLDNDDRVHCFHRSIVGLASHDDLMIDPRRSPNGHSMVDFTGFLRAAYSLPRGSPVTVGKHSSAKPRLLIVARSRTRRFTNLAKIVRMAERSGYEVVVGEAGSNVTRFAHVVNSCDVMVGVHGAGLTNLVFLPTRAVVIQVVPWGRLDWIARTYFEEPARGMRLRYLEYRIGVDESTLADLYGRDHPVLKDPLTSVHKFGWNSVRETYLVKQDVRLNVKRFRPVLLKALKLLHEH